MPVKCPQAFTWECEEPNCCESYHFRVILLFVTIGLFVTALLVAAIWITFEFRPSYRFFPSFNQLFILAKVKLLHEVYVFRNLFSSLSTPIKNLIHQVFILVVTSTRLCVPKHGYNLAVKPRSAF